MAHLLIIEPDDCIRDLMVMLARGGGHEVTAPEPGGALPQWEAFDLLVVEPSCPHGRSVLQQVCDADCSVPVACVSIYPREMNGDLVGDRPYLTKPFTRAGFLGMLDSALHLSA